MHRRGLRACHGWFVWPHQRPWCHFPSQRCYANASAIRNRQQLVKDSYPRLQGITVDESLLPWKAWEHSMATKLPVDTTADGYALAYYNVLRELSTLLPAPRTLFGKTRKLRGRYKQDK